MSLKTLGQLNLSTSLVVFDDFMVDRDLPKFKTQREARAKRYKKKVTLRSEDEEDEDEFGDSIEMASEDSRIHVAKGSFVVTPAEVKPSWWRRLFSRKPKPPVPREVKYVFDLVLSNKEELAVFTERGNALHSLLEQSRSSGQKSFVSQLEAELEIRKFENALFALDLKRYISEAQLLKFVQGCQRGLCLDWVRYFTRPIPAEVIATKNRCDHEGLFDNYAVLHYDPQEKGTSAADRAKEEARKRDPILFGLMRGSRKLYFIGDWVDEFCDLTLQQIVDKLGTGEQTEIV